MSCTGVAIFNINTFEPVHITSIKTNAKDEYGDRLHAQREFMRKLISRYPPYEVAIEKGFSLHNTSTQVVYRVHGVAQELFYKYPQFYYAPTTVKKNVTGNGRSKKCVVQNAILKRYPNITFKNQDESDAAGVAITHLISNYDMK